jgi:phosphoserine phosphatase
VTWLRDDVDALATRLAIAVAACEWLDAFLFAAGMLQVAEDALDSEPALVLQAAGRLRDGRRPSRGAAATAYALARSAGAVAAWRPPAGVRRWTLALSETVALLADRVCDARAPADEHIAASLREVLDGLEAVPGAVRRRVARQPACFRAFDQHPDDMRELVARFAGLRPARDRPLLVAGVRTSGSYLAPLAAASLRAAGYTDVHVVTLRPARRLRVDQRALCRSVSGRGGLALVCDDPPASGRAVGGVARDLERRGLEVVLLLSLFGDALPASLRGLHSVVLAQADWAVTARLEPASVKAAVAQLSGPGTDVVSCERLPDAPCRPARGHVRRAYRIGVRVATTGELRTRMIGVEGVGLGHFGAHALAVHHALEPFLPAVLGLRDGLLYREWLPVERRADRSRAGDRERVAARLAGYVDARARALALREDHTLSARGERPAWEIAGLILAAAFGPAEPAARVLLIDPAVRRLLHVSRPAETDGRMELSCWFAARDGELVKVAWAEPSDAGGRAASCDPVCDLAQVAGRSRDAAPAGALRAAWAALGREPVEPERWLLYELAHLWSARTGPPEADPTLREGSARAMRDYFHEVFFADLRPTVDGPLCAIDVDGVLELEVLGFPALSPGAAAALRALIAHGHRPVLVSGRGIAEIAERCAAYRLPGGVAEYGAVMHVAADGATTSLLTADETAALDRIREALSGAAGVRVDPTCRHVVRAHVLDGGGRRRPPPSATVTAAIGSAAARGVRTIVGDGQTDVVITRVDKAVGARALAARLGADPRARTPLHFAVGDTGADAPMLALAARPFVPAHATGAVRASGRVTRHPYQAGLCEAVGELLGHPPGSCAECRVADAGDSRRLLLALLALREGGMRGVPRQALRVALAR